MIKIIIVHHTQVNQVEFYYVLKVKNISNTRIIFKSAANSRGRGQRSRLKNRSAV